MSPDTVKTLSSESPEVAAPASAATEPRRATVHEFEPAGVIGIVGYIDNIEAKRVSGWAWNRFRPAERLDIEIRLDGQTIAGLRAERHRPDLERVAIGDGKYGFLATFDEPMPEDAKQRVTAFAVFADGRSEIELVNRMIPSAQPAARVDASHAAARFEEWLESQRLGQSRLQETLESALNDIAESARNGGEARGGDVEKTLAEIRVAQDAMQKQLKSIETFQLRCDASLAALNRRSVDPAAQPEPTSDQGLWMMVLGLGVASAISLGLGIYAVAF